MLGLVTYTSGEDSEDDTLLSSLETKRRAQDIKKPIAKKQKIPYPTALLAAKPTNGISEKNSTPTVNDKGKIRMFPHVTGNWATHAYIEVTVDDWMAEALKESLPIVAQNLKGTNTVYPLDETPLHISVTRTVVLRQHEIDSFVELTSKNIKKIAPFWIELDGLACFTNDAAVRSFISMNMVTGREGMISLVTTMNKILEKYNQPIFYK
eukprot:Ihof_evm6s130 gene=Ihof_evmTU6s130